MLAIAQELPFGWTSGVGYSNALVDFAKKSESGRVDLNLNSGTVPVDMDRAFNGLWFGKMLQAEPVFGERHTVALIAPITGRAEGNWR